MAIYSENFTISSIGFNDAIDITSKIQTIVLNANTQDALVNISVTSPCVSVLVLKYEPNLINDINSLLETLAPVNMLYKHDITWHEGNAFAHIRAAMLGTSINIGFKNNVLQLKDWQRIILIDFDNKSGNIDILVNIIF